MAKGTLQSLRDRGFDESYHIPFTSEFKVRCSQCQALAICGVPTHESGCPNQIHRIACHICGYTFSSSNKHQSVCPDCADYI